MQLSPTTPLAAIELETPFDARQADALVDAAFGPGRYAKAAERLREGARPIPELSFVAREGRELVGSVRLWPVEIGGAPALFLGPIAVAARLRRSGVGAMLMEAALAAADRGARRTILLVGDPWFHRFGFRVAEAVRMPGPVDPRRVLIRGEDLRGAVLPAR